MSTREKRQCDVGRRHFPKLFGAGRAYRANGALLMKFLRHKDLAPIHDPPVGGSLCVYGTGRHWIERYRRDIFAFA